jgi:hypothetical protein
LDVPLAVVMVTCADGELPAGNGGTVTLHAF